MCSINLKKRSKIVALDYPLTIKNAYRQANPMISLLKVFMAIFPVCQCTCENRRCNVAVDPVTYIPFVPYVRHISPADCVKKLKTRPVYRLVSHPTRWKIGYKLARKCNITCPCIIGCKRYLSVPYFSFASLPNVQLCNIDHC